MKYTRRKTSALQITWLLGIVFYLSRQHFTGLDSYLSVRCCRVHSLLCMLNKYAVGLTILTASEDSMPVGLAVYDI